MTNDPLQKLVIEDSLTIDKEKLVNFLFPLINIDGSSRQFSFLPNFTKLGSNVDKVEVLLLASKARSLIFKVPDGMLPSEIISLDIMPPGSVKSTIKNLFDSRKIKKDKEGRYSLPGYRVDEVIKIVSNKK